MPRKQSAAKSQFQTLKKKLEKFDPTYSPRSQREQYGQNESDSEDNEKQIQKPKNKMARQIMVPPISSFADANNEDQEYSDGSYSESSSEEEDLRKPNKKGGAIKNKKQSNWISFVKSFANMHDMTYPQALKHPKLRNLYYSQS